MELAFDSLFTEKRKQNFSGPDLDRQSERRALPREIACVYAGPIAVTGAWASRKRCVNSIREPVQNQRKLEALDRRNRKDDPRMDRKGTISVTYHKTKEVMKWQ